MSTAVWALLGALLAASLLAAQGDAALVGDRRSLSSSHGAYRYRRSAFDHLPLTTEDDDTMNDEADEYDDTSTDEEEDSVTPHPPPLFKSIPMRVSHRPGDTVVFPCAVNDLGNLVQMWLNGTKTITLNGKALVNRVERRPDLSLQITNVQPEDSAEYTCQIASDPMVKLTHTLIVYSPAKIVSHSPKQQVILGDPLQLSCVAEGHPKPMITWTLHDQPVPNASVKEGGSILEIPRVSKEHQGQYRCIADNTKGYPVNATIMVHVNSKPEISVEKPLIKSGEGESVELVCIVRSQTNHQVKWKKNGEEINTKSGHVKQMNERKNDTYKLIINPIEKDDFGVYTCIAKNKHGVVERKIELSGTPDVPKYITANSKDDKITLEWEVESFAPIVQHELFYRKKGTGDWTSVKPRVNDGDGSIYKVLIELPDVTSGEYEAYFRSSNEFGSTTSEIVDFHGSKNKDINAPVEEETSLERGGKPEAETSISEQDNNAAVFANNSLSAFTLLMALLTVFSFRAMSSFL